MVICEKKIDVRACDNGALLVLRKEEGGAIAKDRGHDVKYGRWAGRKWYHRRGAALVDSCIEEGF